MTKLGVFLAEDHAMVREGLKMIVNAQPDMGWSTERIVACNTRGRRRWQIPGSGRSRKGDG